MTALDAARQIDAVLFDFDGTLTAPGSIDFDVIREAVGCPKGRPVLEFIAEMPSEHERAEAARILEQFETEAARRSVPNDGAEEIVAYIRDLNVKIGIISRNSLASIEIALRNFESVGMADFDVVLSRDDPFNPKPSPEGILAAAARLGTTAAQVLVVGDFVFDIEAGHNAGALTAYLTNRNPAHAWLRPPDFTIRSLRELKEILDGRNPEPGPPGQ